MDISGWPSVAAPSYNAPAPGELTVEPGAPRLNPSDHGITALTSLLLETLGDRVVIFESVWKRSANSLLSLYAALHTNGDHPLPCM